MADLPPNPSTVGSLKTWAFQVYDYLKTRTEVDQNQEPRPILLAHQVDGVLARATVEGLVMYDPKLGQVVTSKNGQWIGDSRLQPTTTAELNDANANVNMYKFVGYVVYNTDDNTVYVASGPNATDPWRMVATVIGITPS